MASLVSAVSHETLVLPAEQRPPASSAAVALPVIDFSGPRDEVQRAILEAGKEVGFFQVVNHGVPEQTVRDMKACYDFFHLPPEDKAPFYSDEDKDKPCCFISSANYDPVGGEPYWRDCLRLAACGGFPITADAKAAWPDKPEGLRDATERFMVATRRLGMEVLRLLCESLGLRPDYFEGDITGDVVVKVNHYPACPDPARTLGLGLPPHCDRGIITLIHQGSVAGLEVLYRGDWICLQPQPDAFVVNFGHQLEIVTNGLLKSIEHRVVRNPAVPRTSVGTFIVPTDDCVVAPAAELAAAGSARYRAVMYQEFESVYKATGGCREDMEKVIMV